MNGSIPFCGKTRLSTEASVLAVVAVILMFSATSCVNKGDLRFNPVPDGETYAMGGTISLPEIVEDQLLGPLRTNLVQLSDFTHFTVSAGEKSVTADKSGGFSLDRVPFAENLVIKAQAGKIVLLRRVYPVDLRTTDVSQLTLNLDSTTRALIWQAAKDQGKELTEWDIAAREFQPAIASISLAMKLALQMPPGSVSGTVLELAAIQTPVKELASKIEAREKTIREAYSVIEHAILRHDIEIFAHYISSSFTNDWNSTSSWMDLLSNTEAYFEQYDSLEASTTILQMELLPNNEARVRTVGEIHYHDYFSDQTGTTGIYQSDVLWHKEGSFWKIFRNLPYKLGDPSQVGADARWGDIARNHAALQTAIFREDLDKLEELISPNFHNDWDATSTNEDLIETARLRFNACDTKIATYTIHSISFVGTDLARVTCSTQVRVMRLIPGIDVDSGPIKAIVDWRRENGVWKVFGNLPYRFSHPLNIQ